MRTDYNSFMSVHGGGLLPVCARFYLRGHLLRDCLDVPPVLINLGNLFQIIIRYIIYTCPSLGIDARTRSLLLLSNDDVNICKSLVSANVFSDRSRKAFGGLRRLNHHRHHYYYARVCRWPTTGLKSLTRLETTVGRFWLTCYVI